MLAFFRDRTSRRHRQRSYYFLLSSLSGLIAIALIACSTTRNLPNPEPAIASKTDPLLILWDKGYVTEEDEAIAQVVANWRSQGNPVKLSFYSSSEIVPKALRASQSGRQPDILFAAKSVYPVAEWGDALADVTDVVEPLANSYTPDALQAAKVYGNQKANRQKREGDRYYAVPINQSFTHIYYWKDLVAEAGYTPEDIPQDWNGFWSFWKTVQSNLSEEYPDLHSVGLPYSAPATDTYHAFEQVLVAYDVELLDENAQLRLDEPAIRAQIVQCLDWYLQFYREGYTPKDAKKWLDTDNNRQLLNRQVVMTANPSLSIAAAVRNDEKTYRELLGILEFPNKPNGEPSPHLIDIRQAVVFSDSARQEAAKDFLSYLTQPEVLSQFLKASYGRFLPPAISQIEADPFWQNSDDPHVYTAVKTATEGRVKSFYNALNPAYGKVMEENVWGKAIYDIAVGKRSTEEAADWAIAEIKNCFKAGL